MVYSALPDLRRDRPVNYSKWFFTSPGNVIPCSYTMQTAVLCYAKLQYAYILHAMPCQPFLLFFYVLICFALLFFVNPVLFCSSLLHSVLLLSCSILFCFVLFFCACVCVCVCVCCVYICVLTSCVLFCIVLKVSVKLCY